MMDARDALVMVALFSVIGLVAGVLIFFYDLKRRSK